MLNWFSLFVFELEWAKMGNKLVVSFVGPYNRLKMGNKLVVLFVILSLSLFELMFLGVID